MSLTLCCVSMFRLKKEGVLDMSEVVSSYIPEQFLSSEGGFFVPVRVVQRDRFYRRLTLASRFCLYVHPNSLCHTIPFLVK